MKELDGELYTTKEYHHELRLRTLMNIVAKEKGLDEEEKKEARKKLEDRSIEEISELLYVLYP